jgi:hypothetical protein
MFRHTILPSSGSLHIINCSELNIKRQLIKRTASCVSDVSKLQQHYEEEVEEQEEEQEQEQVEEEEDDDDDDDNNKNNKGKIYNPPRRTRWGVEV